MKKILFALILFIANSSFSQDVFREFTIQDSVIDPVRPLLLEGNEGELLLFFREDSSIYFSRSNDGGITWGHKSFVSEFIPRYPSQDRRLDGVKLPDGTIYFATLGSHLSFLSKDNGNTWEFIRSPSISPIRYFKLSVVNDTTIWHGNGNSKTIFKSFDGGRNWTEVEANNYFKGWHKTYTSLGNNKTLVVYHIRDEKPLYGRISDDGGVNWGPQFRITDDEFYHFDAELERVDDKIILVYSKSEKDQDEPISPISIEYITSTDGVEWSDAVSITKFAGPDYKHNTSLVNGELYTSFLSIRDNNESIWFGKTETGRDIYTPPYIEYTFGNKNVPNFTENIVSAKIYYSTRYLDATLQYKRKNEEYNELKMYDDGQHGDLDNWDNIFAVELPPRFSNDTLYFRVKAEDDEGLITYSEIDTIVFTNQFTKYLLDVNNFKLPIDNKGVLAHVVVQYPDGEERDGGKFRNKTVLFSGGFGLSGYNSEGTLWSNGQITSSRVEDYLPGKVDSIAGLDDELIYVIKKNVPPFSDSWQKWADAVKLGAYFYDGDNDGEYNPVDKNENGVWDENEDRPDIMGDVTTWMVYNDGKEASLRRFSNINPQGIEIRQTIWGYKKVGALNNTVFIRYSILNIGKVSDVHDSVYFSIWDDPDIGSDGSAYTDDKTGCDTLLNSGYAYNDGYDNDFGSDPPALFTAILQGPIVKSTNTESIAYSKMGLRGEDSLKGFINLPLTSFNWYGGLTGHDDPDNEYHLRNYHLGRNIVGNFVDPCDFIFGKVVNYDCNKVNPIYFFSGDPEKQTGWLHDDNLDLRILSNTGPFRLEKGKPVDIIVAYIIGDGESALNSVTVGKEYAKQIQSFYENNFTHYVVSDVNEEETLIPTELSLSQNYPNPFNPTTVIEYSIPAKVKSEKAKGSFIPSGVEGERVQLKVYDVLGREVQTLVKKEHSPGNYKVIFPGHSGEGRNLSSGVYFYRLEYGTNIITRKMLLLK